MSEGKKKPEDIAYSIRLPVMLAKRIDKVAERQHRSKNSMIIVMLDDAIKKVE